MKLKTNNVTVTKSIIKKILMVACIASLLVGSGSASAFAAATASQTAITEVNLEYRTDNVQEGDSFRVYLNNENVTDSFSNPICVTTEGRTLLPLRDLGNLLSATIDWDANNKVAIVTTTDNKTIEVPIGATDIIVNGSKNKIDNEGTQAIILSSRTYLPFRAIAEACGATVDYKVGSDGSKNIYLTTSGSTTVTPPTEIVSSDPTLAAMGIYTATDLGYSATEGPEPGAEYYDSWNRIVSGFKQVGLTDEQINSNLQYIYLCPANGDGTTTATKEQARHFDKVTTNATRVSQPLWVGEYKYQMYYGYMWGGTSWTIASETLAGLAGVGLSMS